MSQVVVIEEADSSILGILNDAVPQAERNFANDMFTVYVSTVTVDRENVDSSFEKGIFLRKYIFFLFYLLSPLVFRYVFFFSGDFRCSMRRFI